MVSGGGWFGHFSNFCVRISDEWRMVSGGGRRRYFSDLWRVADESVGIFPILVRVLAVDSEW